MKMHRPAGTSVLTAHTIFFLINAHTFIGPHFNPLYSDSIPINIDAISMGLPIMFFNGSQVDFSSKL